MKRFLKLFIITTLVLLLLIQLFPKAPKNQSASISASDITQSEKIPDSVLQIIKTSCYDCHSNHTNYPWYYRIQPVAWWLNHHIEEGKEELNFAEWGSYPSDKKYHKLREIEEVVTEAEMPPSSYLLMHKKARLSESQKKILVGWTATLGNELRKNESKASSNDEK